MKQLTGQVKRLVGFQFFMVMVELTVFFLQPLTSILWILGPLYIGNWSLTSWLIYLFATGLRVYPILRSRQVFLQPPDTWNAKLEVTIWLAKQIPLPAWRQEALSNKLEA